VRIRPGRAGLVLALACVGVLGAPTPAFAHALLKDADPPQGASLTRSPTGLTLTFTEAPDPNVSLINVLDSNGRAVPHGPIEVVPGRPDSLRVSVSNLPEGIYTIDWRALSTVDGHIADGSYALGVGVPAPSTTSAAFRVPASPSPTTVAVAARAAFYLALVALLGTAWMALLVVPGAGASLARAAGVAWLVALIGAVGITQAQRATADVPWGDVLASSLGQPFLWRLIPVAVIQIAVAAALMSDGRARRAAFAVVAGGALAAMVGDVTSSHAAASSSRWVQGTVQWVHFASAAVWVGGLGALLLATRRLVGDELAGAARRYSTVAGVALGVVVATGVTRAVNEVGGWARLIDTGFGRLVLLKSSLLLVLAGLGGINRFRHVPAVRESVGGLRRVGTAELAVAAVVLAATGLLVNLSPGGTPRAAALETVKPVRVTGADFGTTTRVTLEATPGTVGSNRFVVRVSDYDSGAPVAVGSVRLRFTPADQPGVGESVLELPRAAPGRFAATGTNLSLDGRWKVTVLVPRGVEAVEVPLELATSRPTQRVDVRRTPGLPTIYTVALAGTGKVQIYLDPGKPGPNALHVTFVDSRGGERPVDALSGTATGPDGVTSTLELRKLTPGHFSAETDAGTGRWRYSITGSANGVRVAADVTIDVGG
jgi:copper transport protein